MPSPSAYFGSTRGRCWVTTSTTETPAERASSLELVQRRLRILGTAPRRHGDEQRSLVLAHLARAGGARELLLELPDESLEVEVEERRRLRLELLDRRTLVVGGAQGGREGAARQTVAVGRDADHGVEPEQRQVREVVAGQPLASQVGMNAAQAPQAPRTGTHPPPIRELDGAGVAHHGVGDGAPTIDQYPDLTAGRGAQLRELPGELVGDEAIGGKLAAEETLELANLSGPKALGIAEDSDRWLLAGGRPRFPIYEGPAIGASRPRGACPWASNRPHEGGWWG